MTEAVTTPTELSKITLNLDPNNSDEQITVEVTHYEAEAGIDGHPGFPAETGLLLSERIEQGLIDLTPERARALIPAIHRFADELGPLADKVDAMLAGSAPSITTEPRTWTFQPPAWVGCGPITETCPTFCRQDHTGDQRAHPEDIWHQQMGPAVRVKLSAIESDDFPVERVLEAQLTTRPHCPQRSERVPHVTIEWSEGLWTEPLDPDGLAALIHSLSAHVDNLRIVHSQLVKAVAEHQDGGQ